MVGNQNPGFSVEPEPSASHLGQPAAAVDDQIVYLQLRPGSQSLGKCLGHLQRAMAAHPQARVDLAGYASEHHQYRLTLSVNAGPREQIAKFSPASIAAFNFAEAVFRDLFDFLPLYCTAPDQAERDNAAALTSVMTARQHGPESLAG